MINQQSDEWSNLISQQVKEELDLYDVHAPQVRNLYDFCVVLYTRKNAHVVTNLETSYITSMFTSC